MMQFDCLVIRLPIRVNQNIYFSLDSVTKSDHPMKFD